VTLVHNSVCRGQIWTSGLFTCLEVNNHPLVNLDSLGDKIFFSLSRLYHYTSCLDLAQQAHSILTKQSQPKQSAATAASSEVVTRARITTWIWLVPV